jgi:hypothetical protein
LKLILNLLLLFVAFIFVRRAVGRLFAPRPTSPPPRQGRQDPPPEGKPNPSSGKHPAIGEDEVIEEGEFEELD